MLSRREAIVAAGAGALVLSLPAWAGDAAAATAWRANAFLQIGPDGAVVFTCPKAEMGQAVFTALAQVIAEELEVPLERIAVRDAPADPAYDDPISHLQITGGTTSVRGSFTPLRIAAAQAREMLIAAAAETWGIERGSLVSRDGAVVAKDGRRRAGYGDLVAAAARQPVPSHPKLKPDADFRVIGQSVRRLDAPDKVRGATRFGLDVRPADLLFAVIARPPAFGARLRRFDATAALALPGVKAVKQVAAGIALIGETTWAALRGRDALVLDWDSGGGAGLSSDRLTQRFAEIAEQPGLVAYRRGNVAAGFAKGRRRIVARYDLPYLAHTPMEPLNATVRFGGDGCDIWLGTQAPGPDRFYAAAAAGLAPSAVRIHNQMLGGGFGRRGTPGGDVVSTAVEVAKGFAQPVQTVWTREDEMRGGFYRPLVHHRIEVASDAEGWPRAWAHRIVGQSILKQPIFGPFQERRPIDHTTFDGAVHPYAVPDFVIDVHQPELPVPVLWWRSVGHSHTAFAVESMIDELARLAGRDPLDYRLTLLRGQRREIETLRLAADRAGWSRAPAPGRARGLAVHRSFGTVVAHVVEIGFEDGALRLHKVTSALDCGLAINPNQIAAQVESNIAYALSAALEGEISLRDGVVQQGNFDDYPALRMHQMPAVEVHIVPSQRAPTGIGEPGLPPLAPALVNAIAAAGGQRIRSLPLSRHNIFVA